MTQTTNLDDYYSSVPKTPSETEGEKKSGLKLKIKAKKPSDAVETPEAPRPEVSAPVAATPAPAPAPVSVPETPKKSDTFRPIISFEAAPKIVPRAPQAPRPVATQRPPVRTDSRPTGPRPNEPRRTDPAKPAPKPFNNPLLQERGFKVRKHEPRISFEAAPKFNTAPKPATPAPAAAAAGPNANRLAQYSKSHQNAPKRGRNSLPAVGGKKTPGATGGDGFRNKKGLRVQATVEDDGKFRRGKKFTGDKKERSDSDIKQILTDKTGQEVAIPEMLAVKEFSEKIGVPLPKIIAELMKNGMMTNLNTKIDFDTCYLIGEVFQVKITREHSTEASMTDIMKGNTTELLKNDDPEKMVTRAPIISIMGHVDHGKTSILDYIRKTSVASGEAGGITQKIGAYQVDRNGKKITFLDTPGHEAFSIMRSRGAKLTDLAVIVIAADEGMKPQTIESINHAKAANVPVVIAVNKMDKPGANLDLIRGQMAEQGLQPEDWGGDTIMVPVSAHTGLGIETLLDMIILSTDIMELKAHPTRPAVATVIESHLDQKLGSLATVLVNAGTLKKGDYVVCASAYGRVRGLKDYRGKNIDEAGPSVPVQVMGLSKVVEGGDLLQVMPDAVTAQTKAHEFELAKGNKSIHNFEGASLNMLLTRIKTGALKQLKIVIKCDSNGSLEALKSALSKLSTAETQVTFIHSGVGEINDSDVLMAGTSQALLVAYNVGVNIHARQTLANSKIEFIDKKVIYHVLEKVENIITGMVDLRFDDVDLGTAEVKAIFYNGKDKFIAGLAVKTGKIENKSKVRVIRNNEKVGSGEVVNLKTGPLDVHEIEAGGECGITFKGDLKLEIGDMLELYKMVARK